MAPVLDRRFAADERDALYPMRPRSIVRRIERRKREWITGPTLDQGEEGACVGHGWTTEIMASPFPINPLNPGRRGWEGWTPQLNSYAFELYREAQLIDEWDDTPPGEGTSVRAGAKIAMQRGLIKEFRWCETTDDVIDTLCMPARDGGGPVVIGIWWYDSMYFTRPSGLVEVEGRKVGGHCLTITGYHPGIRLSRESYTQRFEVFKWRNSWGTTYGRNGNGYITVEDFDRLLNDQGEACVPMYRQKLGPIAA